MPRTDFNETNSDIPGIPTVERFLARSSHGVPYIVGMMCILALFTATKAPYFHVPFTGGHSIKYNTYVEPALYMSQKNDPTWFQAKYKSDPVENPKGIFHHFNDFPLFEWGLFATYKIIPSGSIETKTRIYTHIIGVLLLVSAYLFFRKWVSEYLALLMVFMMSINPIIVFGTFVTILDSLSMVLMFSSFVLLSGYLKSRKMNQLFLASLLFGIGVAIKYSMLLWTMPIALSLFFYERKSNIEWIIDSILYCFLGILFVVANITSVAKLPTHRIGSIIMIFVWIFVYVLLYYLIVKKESNFNKFIDTVIRKKIILLLLGIFALGAGKILYDALDVKGLARHYLTDSTLLFNWKYYLYMVRIQFKNYITPTFFWMGAMGIALSFLTGSKELKKMMSAFLLGSTVYLLLASKTIFVHNYYTMIIMILFSMGAASVIHYILTNIQNGTGKIIVFALFLVLLFPRALEQSVSMLDHYEDVRMIDQFIMNNTSDDDIILNNSLLTPIAIYTGRSFAFVHSLEQEKVMEDIKKIGFTSTMRKYHVKYFFSQGEQPSYIDFAPLFSKTEVEDPRFNDRHFIFQRLGETNDATNRGYEELEMVVEKYDIAAKFKLAADFGKYKFYSFVDDAAK